MSLVFFGTEAESRIALQVLVEAGVEIEAVITKPDTQRGRGQKLQAPEVKSYVEGLNELSSRRRPGPTEMSDDLNNYQDSERHNPKNSNNAVTFNLDQSSLSMGPALRRDDARAQTEASAQIQILQPPNLKEFALSEEFQNLKSDYAVLVSYGKIIPQVILDKFKAIINIHPSLLPDLRGPSPVQTAMMRGDKDFGLSIMKLEAGMDSGPVYWQGPVGVHGVTMYRDVLNTLVELGARKLVELLPSITGNRVDATEKLEPKAQDESKATYCKMITKEDALLDFNLPASQVAAKINALSEWPKCKITLHNVENVSLLKTEAVTTPNNQLKPNQTIIGHDGAMLIGCGEGAVALDLLQPPGGKAMSSRDFWNGAKGSV
jgi:methionyl-tRNA formyltransferase